jgi:tetratricopeptide (TPR) repeat protein
MIVLKMKKLVLTLLSACFVLLLYAQDADEALAYQYYQEGDYARAAVVLEKLFNKTRSDSYLELYFNALLKTKKYDEAEKALKKLMRLDPKNLKYAIELGRVYQEKGQTEEAKKLFLQTIYKLPADEMKIRDFANYFYRIEAYDLAIETFRYGRTALKNEQLFTFELLSLYRFKKDKNFLVQEYVNALGDMPQLLQQAQNMLSNTFESDADYLVLQSLLLKKLQKEPDKEVYTELLIWQYLQRKDYKMALRQLLAQDKRTKDDGKLLFFTANTFVANAAYDMAIEAYTYLLGKGKESPYYLPARIELLNTRYVLFSKALPDSAQAKALAMDYYAIIEEYGKNQRTVFALRKWAELQAYYLNQPEQAVSALEEVLTTPGLPDAERNQLKLDLGDLYIATAQPWEAVLIYEQVAKQAEGQPIGNEARYRSARLSFYQGNFKYAKLQADILKASTSQLIANDALNLGLLISDNLQSSTDSLALKMYADAEMLQFRKQYTAAIKKLDSIAAKYPNNSLEDDVLMTKSRIYTDRNETAQAVAMLKVLIGQHASSIWIDDALFTTAGLYETKLNDKEQAMALYQRLINDFPGSMYAAEARKHFRSLRGDVIGP